MHILLKNDSSLKNIAIVNGEKFLESTFDRNQIWKILLTKNRNIWKLLLLIHEYFFFFCHSTSVRSKSGYKWNYTLFFKTPSKTMQNFSWNMQDIILKVNMLYFLSAIVKIWHIQKTKGLGFCISFDKKKFSSSSKLNSPLLFTYR